MYKVDPIFTLPDSAVTLPTVMYRTAPYLESPEVSGKSRNVGVEQCWYVNKFAPCSKAARQA